MNSAAIAQSVQAVTPEATDTVLLLVVLSGGLVGMSIRNMLEDIVSDDGRDATNGDGRDATSGGALGGDGLMADDGDGDGDDLDGLGGLDDGDDLGGFDDEFGEMEEAGGADVDELEHRLDELESEVGSLSSTVNTVRNENEQISESVEAVEENVRKLLDIYEMVTRGVNPFADDIDAGMSDGAAADGGSFGLFDGEDEAEEDNDLDEDIAEADAEGFFDEELVEDDETDDADDLLGGTAGGADGGSEPGGNADDDGGDGGTSFEELKDEYESGEADWADDGEAADGERDDADEADESELGDDIAGDDLASDDLFDDVVEEDAAEETGAGAASETEPEPDPVPAQAPEPAPEETTSDPEPSEEARPGDESGSATDEQSSGEGKPYLTTLPEGFAAELVVIEWLEFLVEEVGVRETARALEYYETIDWVDGRVADDLQEYLGGFDGGGSGALTIDHHTRSLEYIGQIDGSAGAAAFAATGGVTDGIQR